MPHLNELAQAERPRFDNMALESLTEILRCARHPENGYPSPELAIACLKLIRKSDYVDALVQVEQLAVVKDRSVYREARKCAAHLLAIVEGSNYTDHLLLRVMSCPFRQERAFRARRRRGILVRQQRDAPSSR